MDNTLFNHGKIRIIQSYSPVGKHVECMINRGEYWEHIDPSDDRARKAFIALHNFKWEV